MTLFSIISSLFELNRRISFMAGLWATFVICFHVYVLTFTVVCTLHCSIVQMGWKLQVTIFEIRLLSIIYLQCCDSRAHTFIRVFFKPISSGFDRSTQRLCSGKYRRFIKCYHFIRSNLSITSGLVNLSWSLCKNLMSQFWVFDKKLV